MTAFKNGRAALAVTAGLVGALSLGSAAIAAAPVSAYAEATVKMGAGDKLANGDIRVTTWNNRTVESDGSTTFSADELAGRAGETAPTGYAQKYFKVSVKPVGSSDYKTVTAGSATNAAGEYGHFYVVKDDGDGKLDKDDTYYSSLNASSQFDEGTYFIVALTSVPSGSKANGANVNDLVDLVTPAADGSDNSNGGKVVTFKVGKKEGAITNADVLLTVPSDLQYNGLDKLADVKSKVFVDGKTLTRGEDYDLVVFNEATNKTTDKAVDAGTYDIRVTSDKYDVSGINESTLANSSFTISPLTLKGFDGNFRTADKDGNSTTDIAKMDGTNNATFADLLEKGVPENFATYGFYAPDLVGLVVPKGTLANGKYAYTGSEIEAGYKFLAKPVVVKKDGKLFLDTDASTWVDLPAEAYTASYLGTSDDAEKDTALKDFGAYTATLDVKGGTGSNFYAASPKLEVEVAKKVSFTDVPATAWYADAVYESNSLGYLQGFEGTSLFGPESGLTRAQAAQVFYNMANGQGNGSWGKNDSFSDVSGWAWYADAVAWAKAYGVVNGYPDGTFQPEQLVTREEFATMLRNYAQKSGQGEAKTADLSKYTDADQLGWSKDAVSWAVANKVFGQGVDWLAPQATITRAQVAKMVVTFQPDGKLDNSDL